MSEPGGAPMGIEEYLERNKAEHRVTSETECLDLLREFTGLEEDKYRAGTGRGLCHLFRGHSEASYPLLTTLDRLEPSGKRRAEDYLLREFRRRMHQYLPPEGIPVSELVTLALMQHYGVPTRLLDVTRSPYVALYFAVRAAKNDSDAAVWVFNTTNIRGVSLKRVFSQDPDLAEEIGNLTNPCEQFTRRDRFEKWLMPDPPPPGLQDDSQLRHHAIVIDIEPFRMNARQSAQQGLFLISGSPTMTFEQTLVDLLQEIQSGITEPSVYEPSVCKIVIPGALRRPLMRHLEKMNITAASLFEGIEGLAASLREKIAMMDRHDFLGYMFGFPT